MKKQTDRELLVNLAIYNEENAWILIQSDRRNNEISDELGEKKQIDDMWREHEVLQKRYEKVKAGAINDSTAGIYEYFDSLNDILAANLPKKEGEKCRQEVFNAARKIAHCDMSRPLSAKYEEYGLLDR